eukprot:jgi/Botrbrau1/17728/Bobra.0166s0149.1
MQAFGCQTMLSQCNRCLRVAPHSAARPVAFRASAQPPSVSTPPRSPRKRQWPHPVQAAAVEAPSAPTAEVPEAESSDIQVDPKAKYAVVDIGGGQLLIEEGRWYTVNRLQAEIGSKIELKRVLALKNEGELTVGVPYLENVKVEAEILEDVKGPKLTIFKYRPKKHYRRKTGHRQPLTKFLVTKISA